MAQSVGISVLNASSTLCLSFSAVELTLCSVELLSLSSELFVESLKAASDLFAEPIA